MAIYSDLPFVHALGDGGVRTVTQVACIHATDNTASASAEASYARTRPDKTSAHFYVDDRQVIQALDTANIAYGCLYHGNHISIQFELCGLSNQVPDSVLRKAAATVARVCRDNGIPVRKVGASDVRNGVKGICGHGDITAAFPEDNGDHTDPGAQFPWVTFLKYISGGANVDEIERKAGNADLQANAILNDYDDVTINLAGGGTVKVVNTAKKKREELKTILSAGTAQPAVALSDADKQAIVTALAGLVPSAADIATAVLDEQHRRDAA